MDSQISPPVDFQKFAIDVAHRLSSLQYFLDASEDLLRLNNLLTDADVKCHGRKILAMTEAARMTLNHAGLKLHLFTSCSPKFQPFKSAYFKMLVLVCQHRHEFQPELQGRVNRLLLPLTTRLVIFRNNDPYAQLGIAESMKSLRMGSELKKAPPQNAGDAHRTCLLSTSNNIAASMPPPDAFPPKPPSKEERDKRFFKKKMLFSMAIPRLRPVHRQHPVHPVLDIKSSGTDDESAPSTPRVFARTRRHFGIFCTGKQSGRA
ncbi:hypothetical protein F5I97DRAFT_1907561 [Phlebopus sp. FC_14]|nr:hypothetical protein F5I97DRAFT_1907561 [Phlebopus sp. FC_14]